jgi:hypothetical protein
MANDPFRRAAEQNSPEPSMAMPSNNNEIDFLLRGFGSDFTEWFPVTDNGLDLSLFPTETFRQI